MDIIAMSNENINKVDQYLMISSPAVKTINTLPDDTVIAVDAWVLYNDVKSTGEAVEILSILTPNKDAYACQSNTFKRSFKDIVELMGSEKFSIKLGKMAKKEKIKYNSFSYNIDTHFYVKELLGNKYDKKKKRYAPVLIVVKNGKIIDYCYETNINKIKSFLKKNKIM